MLNTKNMPENKVTVENIMTKEVISLEPNDSIEKATELFEKHNFDGFPVVEEGKLVGIVTAYDMVNESYATHLPLLAEILEDISNDKKDRKHLEEQFKKVKSIKIKDMMNIDPLVVRFDVSVEELAKEFIQHHRVNPIPVVDADKNLLGIVSRFDILRFFDEKYFNKVLQASGHEGILRRLARM